MTAFEQKKYKTGLDIADINEYEHSKALKDQITDYWAGRSGAQFIQRRSELYSPLADAWKAEFEAGLPGRKPLRILDVGTGCGFFPVLLNQMGHSALGIDLTPEMIEGAYRLASFEHADAKFMVMDAESLNFPDESFDAVVSRNLTWTLPDPEKAYSEWLRVLKKGGVLLNFDADYGKEDLLAELGTLPKEHSHNMVSVNQLAECDAIKKQLSISMVDRPDWDLKTLLRLGCADVSADPGANDRINPKEGPMYNPMSVFRIRAVK